MSNPKTSDCWRKKLTDSSFELGLDEDIEKGFASWTKGRQDIVSALLSFNKKSIEVKTQDTFPFDKCEQYDNFCFDPTTGISTRISRELRCSINGYKKINEIKDMANIYNVTSFILNNDYGQQIPNGVTTLVCRIEIDGTVSIIWR